jgi:putative protein-disulfide isomerase
VRSPHCCTWPGRTHSHGRSLADAEVYRGIAGELGLDADAVTAAYSAQASRMKARADFRTLRRLRVLSYPTLLLHTAHGADQMGGAASQPPPWPPHSTSG